MCWSAICSLASCATNVVSANNILHTSNSGHTLGCRRCHAMDGSKGPSSVESYLYEGPRGGDEAREDSLPRYRVSRDFQWCPLSRRISAYPGYDLWWNQGHKFRPMVGQVVVWLRCWPIDRRVAGSIPESTNFLTNNSGQAILTLWCPCSPSSKIGTS